MQLVHSEIPDEFLRAIPEGIKLVKRHGHEFLVVERVMSPGGTSLMADSVRIHGEPTIAFAARIAGERGTIFVDAFWGSHAKLFSFLPPVASGSDYTVEAVVRGTDESLMVDDRCTIESCGSTKAIEFVLPGGENRIRVCARLGCPGHRIVLADLARPVAEAVSGINFFGAGSLEEDWFDDPR